jgi:hypothetical protein
MDDNLPYKSSEEDDLSEKEDDDTLLLEELPEVEEDGELQRKESLQLLEKKIYENEKRKKELLDLKRQYESEILLKTNKAQYERVKQLIREDSE